MDEKQPEPTNVSPAGPGTNTTGGANRNPELLPDGTHLYRVVGASIPSRGVNGLGVGEVMWHPERGIQFKVEVTAKAEPLGIEGVLAQLARPATPSRGAGAVFEPSRDPELVARLDGTGEPICVFQIAAGVNAQSQNGPASASAKTIISGTAVAATVRVERDSELSYWHETLGACRLLVPDICMYHWPTQDYAKWTSGGTHHSSLRSSCPLSESPKLTVFSASSLPGQRSACWLAFEPALIPVGERDWYTPDVCLAAVSFLSFLGGKRLPFLWTDRFLDDTHVTRTYHGTAKVDDFPQAADGYQPAPLNSLQHGGAVVERVPAIFAASLTLRKWFDLDWITGPLWYAIKAYLDDKLGLASVSLERFATALDAFLAANPGQKRSKAKFLTKPQSRALRGELSAAVSAFAKDRGIDLTASRSPAVDSIIDAAIESIARLDDSLFPGNVVDDLRASIREAVARADKAGKLKLDETKAKIIDHRIDNFAAKTNPDKLTDALEFDGLSLSDPELDAVMKRNDCLHGRRTLGDANNLDDIRAEVDRFDTLRTLINKAVLARLGYRGPYVDYAARPTSGSFPVKCLADELKTPVEE